MGIGFRVSTNQLQLRSYFFGGYLRLAMIFPRFTIFLMIPPLFPWYPYDQLPSILFTCKGLSEKNGCPGAPFWMDTSFQDKTNRFMEHQVQQKTKNSTGWWFQTFLECSISYMGCHPKPIDELHHFSRWAHCTTNQGTSSSIKLTFFSLSSPNIPMDISPSIFRDLPETTPRKKTPFVPQAPRDQPTTFLGTHGGGIIFQMGKSWENHRKMVVLSENHRKTIGKWWFYPLVNVNSWLWKDLPMFNG